MERKKREIYGDLPPRSHPDYMKLYKQKNRERLNEKNRQKNAEMLKLNPNFWKEKYNPIKSAEYREKNRKIITEKQWTKRGIIDITYEKFLIELKKQKNKCKICNTEMMNPQVDHDHITGKYRGILCVPCNNGLGIYENKKELFENYINGTAK